MRLTFFITLSLLSLNLFAQVPIFKNQEFSLSVGASELYLKQSSSNKELDFINYIDTYPEYNDYIIARLAYRADLSKQLSADIQLILMDDLLPDNYDISTHYFLKNGLGIGIGSILNKNHITYFEEYQLENLPDYYLMDSNVKQFTAYDLGFYISPAIKALNYRFIRLLIKCDLGVSSFLKEETTFVQKKKLSNERLQYHYGTNIHFEPYIQPKVDLRLQTFKIKNTAIGLLFNSSYFYSQKSIRYTRTIYTWTSENNLSEKIQSPKHSFGRLQFDMGLFVKL
ncbi:hypothetical protein [Algivirga pacifica]|uniref:Outer membrane protein beta-barrel domain-containing protein n=1 Tax=Algivirga pacifica TaxID=1162670 RepID=A0ABP9D7Z4_9BACT